MQQTSVTSFHIVSDTLFTHLPTGISIYATLPQFLQQWQLTKQHLRTLKDCTELSFISVQSYEQMKEDSI
jgi:hypothetical protein